MMTKSERDYILHGDAYAKSEAELAEMERTLAVVDDVLKSCPSYGSAMFGGAVVGMLTNFVATRSLTGGDPGERHLLRYAAVGAAIGAFSEWAMCRVGKGIAGVEHRLIREARAARLASAHPPPSPVVTKGHFAGAPRPLHHTIY